MTPALWEKEGGEGGRGQLWALWPWVEWWAGGWRLPACLSPLSFLNAARTRTPLEKRRAKNIT